MKLFEYAVIYNPTANEVKDGATSELVVPVKTVLATTQQNAMLLAARAIPEKYLDKLDRLEVAVRPF